MTTFAVIVPVFNGEEFVSDCVESILAQSRLPEEIILIDDGSTDNTSKIIIELARNNKLIKAKSIDRAGVSNARNHGALIAKSEYLLFLDVDDRWHKSKIESHENHILIHTKCKFSFGLSHIFDLATKKSLKIDRKQTKSPSLFNVLMHEFQILGSSSSVCLKREFFEFTGGFNPEIARGEDWELWVRCSQLTEPCQIEQVLVAICFRNNSVEQSKLDGIKNYYSTALHLKVWSDNLSSVSNVEFSQLAIRILFADLWKNRRTLIPNWRKYDALFTREGSQLLPYLKIRGNRFLIFKIILAYSLNRVKNV